MAPQKNITDRLPLDTSLYFYIYHFEALLYGHKVALLYSVTK